jgi:hypothetical protein
MRGENGFRARLSALGRRGIGRVGAFVGFAVLSSLRKLGTVTPGIFRERVSFESGLRDSPRPITILFRLT